MTDFGGHEIGQSPPLNVKEGRYRTEFGVDQIRPKIKSAWTDFESRFRVGIAPILAQAMLKDLGVHAP